MSLRTHSEPDPITGRSRTIITTDRECPNCWQPATIAHTSLEVAAITLAEPLRRAFDKHLDKHGCAERVGIAHCPEAMELFNLLPYGDSWGSIVA